MTQVVESITGTWTAVGDWFIGTMQDVPVIFYQADTGLTFIGTLAVFGGGLAVIIGLIGVIRGWTKAR